MDIIDTLNVITSNAEHYKNGLIGMNELNFEILTAISKYTDKNFVYTGELNKCEA